GPWDEQYECYWCDTDWCMTLGKLGKKIYCVPQATVVHDEQHRADKKKSPSRIWLFHRGAYRLYCKHYLWSRFDPRSLLALLVLSARAAFLLARNHFRAGDTPLPAPATHPPSHQPVSNETVI